MIFRDGGAQILSPAIILFDGYASPMFFSHGAWIGVIALPVNTVPATEGSGLVTGRGKQI
jgi:hypothetical protein